MQYLIVAEILKKGFILKITTDEKEAELFHQLIFDLSNKYPFGESHKIEKYLNYLISYNIKGNEFFISNSFLTSSNGEFSVYVLKIATETFCLKSFIKERENNSIVFNMEELSSEYSEQFLNSNLISN